MFAIASLHVAPAVDDNERFPAEGRKKGKRDGLV